ncbi:MAG: 1,4-dihydroxy-2-naphthoate octaprenyltransferase [Gammaproteobacteria bacterium]|nr:1,4-dihydroxy-2-naphthoate octaprenyltransferase [Gammaproteobacteria bacterium]
MRPKTLAMSVVPVIVGTCLAMAHGYPLVPHVLAATLSASLLILIATNFFNDAFDGEKGHDDPDIRLGPPRAVASGWLPAAQVRNAAVGVLFCVFLLGLFLVTRGGWPILLIGLTSMLATLAYSAGPAPISSGPAGEVLVIIYFGLAAVFGSYYLQSGVFHIDALICGLLIGLPAAGVLMVNNYRDRVNDGNAGRRTLAIVCGPALARLAYAVCVLAPLILLLPGVGTRWHWLPLLTLPLALVLVFRLYTTPIGRELNKLLAGTVGYQALLGFLLCLGWWMPITSIDS